MYTSVNKERAFLRTSLIYIAVSAFTALFGAVYEHYSHGVVSLTMVFAFVPPLILGALTSLVLHFMPDFRVLGVSRQLWRLGVASLAVGMIFNGIIEIYGTDSPLTKYYFIASALLILSSIFTLITKKDG